jgi:hypothetical protein
MPSNFINPQKLYGLQVNDHLYYRLIEKTKF